MDMLIFEDNERDTLYMVINKLQLIFHPLIIHDGNIDYQKIFELQSSDKDILIIVDNNLTSPICEIARNGFLKDSYRMAKVAAFIVWAKSIGARISCGFSLLETDSQKLSKYTAESSRHSFLHAIDKIPVNIWKALAFGAIDCIPKKYLSNEFDTNERRYEYNESLVFLSTEAAIIKIVNLLRENNVSPIDKFITFTNWYADHLSIAESILFYAAAVFSSVPHVAMPKNFKSNDILAVKKGIKNQAWDLTYIINWSIVISKGSDSQCFMFATDDITQKVIILNTIPLGECINALKAIFSTKKEREKINELFAARFGDSRVQPMLNLSDDEKVRHINQLISKEYVLLEEMIR